MALPRSFNRRRWLGGAALGVASLALPGCVRRADVVRLAYIDPLSGPASDVGRNGLLSWQFLAEHLSAEANPARLRFEVAGFDNKGSPQESLHALRAAIDQGFRIVLQGNGSGVASTLSAAIERHNERFPQRGVVLLNYAAMDPSLTRERCSFWHFRLDADTAMKTQALVAYLEQHKAQLDEDSLRRMYSNPLRVLDSKNPALAEILAAAPKLADYLDQDSAEHFARLKQLLTRLAHC